MSKELNLRKSITLAELALAIETYGPQGVVILARGEPGVGKSSVLWTLAEKFQSTHVAAYIDAGSMDLGDVTIPFPDWERKCVTYLPNSIFKTHEDLPVIVMLDEITKALPPVKHMLAPLMNGEQRLGDRKLKPGSFVFATGNMTSDGVGDAMQGHLQNRCVEVRVRKPNAEEWLAWAINHGIAPEVCVWVERYPHSMASYMDGGQEGNPYIYFPGKSKGAFFSPRSAERASIIVKDRAVVGYDLSVALLAGAIGESAARDMSAYITVADKLESYQRILAQPKTCKLPADEPVALCIQTYTLVERVQKDELSVLMDYVTRLPEEMQGLFFKQLVSVKAKNPWVITNSKFITWARKNAYLFE